jgi:molybdopterin converting factor subunit 1
VLRNMTSMEKNSPVTLRIKLFGLFREAAENKEVALSLDGAHTTVGDLKRSLRESYPKLASINDPFIVAVNRKVASDSTTVTLDDEVAILPLVSGG